MARFFSVRPRVISSCRPRNSGAQRGDQRCHKCAAFLAVGEALGGHGALIHRPGGLDLGMSIVGEQVRQPGFLLVGEQIGAGIRGAPRSVERVGAAIAVSSGGQLNPAGTRRGRCRPAGPRGREGIHHCRRVGQPFGCGGLAPGESIHRNNFHPVASVVAGRPASVERPVWSDLRSCRAVGPDRPCRGPV